VHLEQVHDESEEVDGNVNLSRERRQAALSTPTVASALRSVMVPA